MRRCGVRSRTRRCRYPSCRDRAVPAVCGLIWLGIARRSMLPALRRLHIGFAKRSTPIFFSRFTPSFIASADLSYFSLADLNNGQKNGSERTLQFRSASGDFASALSSLVEAKRIANPRRTFSRTGISLQRDSRNPSMGSRRNSREFAIAT